MSGRYNSVQALIIEKQPLAIYTYCFSHGLNLCISKVCEFPSIRSMIVSVGFVSVFLSSSAKCTNMLIATIKNHESIYKKKNNKLGALCTTRRVERHNSIIIFRELYPHVVATLEELKEETDREISAKSTNFNSSIKRSDFLISLKTVANLFSYTKTLSIQLQNPIKICQVHFHMLIC